MSQPRANIRNIAIIAHVDHGIYNDVTINIVDTPGHADFGGEVERVMNMVDGVLLLVDAVEGPMPQTRFVLRQALNKGHKAIVVVNKIDRPAARPDFVVNATFDLFVDLGASDEQADFPVIYTKALEGRAGHQPDNLAADLRPLFEAILEYLPPPQVEVDAPARLLVTTLAYDNYIGQLGIGRLWSGSLRGGQAVVCINRAGESLSGKISQVFTFRDLKRVEQEKVEAGDIVAFAGLSNLSIGDTIADESDPRPLPPITVEEPTVRMTFSVNDSPFAGREGEYVTSRQLRERLWRELEQNVALRVEETDSADRFVVSGRGELHLAILIETMRRESYEFAVSKPEVIFKEEPDGLVEPVEHVFIEVPHQYLGTVNEMMGRRRAETLDVRYGEDGTVYLEFLAPVRGLLGFRQRFLTATRGTGILHTLFHGYKPYSGEIITRDNGSLVALESGSVTTYALTNLQERGMLFVSPEDEVYSGQVVGQYNRNSDLVVNVCKTKHLTNHRKSFAEINVGLTPPRLMSLDEAIEYLGTDELLEVTPHSLRVRKKELKHDVRQKEARRAEY
jgi:GTP-binding protein